MYKLKRETIEQEVPITINSDECKLNFERIDGKTEQDGIPTLETLVEIKNLEGKNLFNVNETDNYEPARIDMTITNNILNLKAKNTSGAQIVRNYVKNVNPNKNYTISFKAKKIVKGTDGFPGISLRLYGSNDDVNYTNLGTTGTYISATNTVEGQEYSLSRTVTGYKHYRFYFYNNASTPVTIGEETEYYDIMFEEGTVFSSYVPYNSIGFKVQNKNLANLIEKNNYSWNGLTVTSYDASSYILNQTASGNSSMLIQDTTLLEAGTYTLSEENLKDNNNNNRIVINYAETSQTLAETSNVTSKTFTIAQDTLINIKMIVLSGSVFNNTRVKVQLEKNLSKTDFAEHQEQTSPFTFEEGQYLTEGGYLADDGIHRKMRKVILDGTEEGWSKNSFISSNNVYSCDSAFPNRKSSGKTLCDYLSNISSPYNDTGINSGSKLYFCFDGDEFNTLAKLKEWLSTHNLEVLYELENEEIIEYNNTQQAQWEAIKSLKSYNGVTHVTVDATLNPKIYFTYNPEITDDIKTAVRKNPEKAYIEVLDDGTILNESNYLQSAKLSDERYLDKQGIFGTVIAKELTGKFVNVDSSFNIENKEIKYYNGPVMSDNSVNYFDYGTYIVQKPENDNVQDNTSFTALDYMVKFNKKFEDRLYYNDSENPVTIRILLQDICDQCEVKLATKTFRNSDYVLENNQFVGGETCREVLSAIAQIAFSWARINEDDELALDFNIIDEITEELDNDDYFSLEFNNKYGPINTIVLSNSQIEGENFTIHSDDFDPETDEEITLEIQDNPFAYTEQKRSELIQAGNAIFGFEYIPMKIKTAGKNYLNCLDKIKIKNMQDEYYETYIFNNKLDFKGITLDEKESPAMTDAQVKYQYTGEILQAIKRTEIIVDKQNGTIESITKNVQNLETSEHNDYQEIIQKFDGYAPKSQVVTLENSVTQLQTDTYTKTEINTKLTDGSVTKVQTISGTFDENGMTYEKTNAETKSTINETGINVKKVSDDETILFAGYVDENNSQYADYKGQTIVATENILVKKYLVIGSHTRFEDYETGTGCFYLE